MAAYFCIQLQRFGEKAVHTLPTTLRNVSFREAQVRFIRKLHTGQLPRSWPCHTMNAKMALDFRRLAFGFGGNTYGPSGPPTDMFSLWRIDLRTLQVP